MKQITIPSYGKINLSIDVLGKRQDGMHEVDMVMHQVAFHDDVKIRVEKLERVEEKRDCKNKEHNREEKFDFQGKKRSDDFSFFQIELSINKPYIPTDNRNLAYKAAELILGRYEDRIIGQYKIDIDIKKRIPVAGGMAGGSANAASVLIGLNFLFALNLTLEELEELGAKLGADVPFCIRGQLKASYYYYKMPKGFWKTSSCIRARGIGTSLTKENSLRGYIIIAKPSISISTKEVYQGIDEIDIKERPNNDLLTEALITKNQDVILKNMINVLENYTLKEYPEVLKLKNLMKEHIKGEKVLMSGSGPTVFALCNNKKIAEEGRDFLRSKGYEAYYTFTTK